MTRASDATAAFASAVGRTGTPTTPRHPVNEPMIAHWCDAMGDENPVYTDAGFASGSVHGGIVAPPGMLDVWDRPGLRAVLGGGSPRTGVLAELFACGYDSIVAVNTELELARYVRPGESLSNLETLESVSPEKRTARGPGHFLTTRHHYTNEAGEHVGDLMFRILVFRAETPPPPEGERDRGSKPDPDPALRPQPAINDDNRFVWEGAASHELRLQQCKVCGRLLQPPGPRCSECGSFEMGWAVSGGRGRLYSYAMPEYPKVGGYEYPVPVALVELEEGVRVVGNLVGLDRDSVEIGMPLGLSWLEGGTFPLPQFRAPDPVRSERTRRVTEVSTGERLPLSSIPVTTTLVVAGAIATRDYTAVHHDVAVAKGEGSKDVFMNINTSVGLVQRVVSDWAGPEAIFRSIRLRLGAPAYPGDLLTFSGSVTAVDVGSGGVTVGLRARDSLGDHAIAEVQLSLPPDRGGR